MDNVSVSITKPVTIDPTTGRMTTTHKCVIASGTENKTISACNECSTTTNITYGFKEHRIPRELGGFIVWFANTVKSRSASVGRLGFQVDLPNKIRLYVTKARPKQLNIRLGKPGLYTLKTIRSESDLKLPSDEIKAALSYFEEICLEAVAKKDDDAFYFMFLHTCVPSLATDVRRVSNVIFPGLRTSKGCLHGAGAVFANNVYCNCNE
jgi:hypothetical protein